MQSHLVPPTPKLNVPLSPHVLKRIEDAAARAELPAGEYAGVILGNHALQDTTSTNASKKVGRPISVGRDDMPPGVERTASASGFAGVKRHGRAWQATIGRGQEPLGTFSTPELAALVRYYVIQGFRVGRARYFEDAGMDPESSKALAAQVGYGVVKPNDPNDPKMSILLKPGDETDLGAVEVEEEGGGKSFGELAFEQAQRVQGAAMARNAAAADALYCPPHRAERRVERGVNTDDCIKCGYTPLFCHCVDAEDMEPIDEQLPGLGVESGERTDDDDGIMTDAQRAKHIRACEREAGFDSAELIARWERGDRLQGEVYVSWLILLGRSDLLTPEEAFPAPGDDRPARLTLTAPLGRGSE